MGDGNVRRRDAEPGRAHGWPRLLSVELAAEYVGLNVELVREYVKSGRLAPVRPRRPDTTRAYRQPDVKHTVRRLLFDRDDLDALVDSWKADRIP